MRASQTIEKYFWVLLIIGILAGLWNPFPFETPKYLPKIILCLMLFFVFLKIDVLEIIEKMKDYKQMVFIAFVYMIVIPLLFFLMFSLFDRQLALGILLLVSMPAGVSTPALTDLLKGNISFAMSIVIVTQFIAPFTIPFLFWMAGSKGLDINELLMFRDIAIMVFLPLILAQITKRHFPSAVKRNQHRFTPANVILLFIFVFIAISMQRNVILENPASLIWKTVLLFGVFILLHVIGYFIRYKDNKENRIALSVTAAYMNNGLAIVLATTYFSPDILVLMVLSEIPWNTLLAPFGRVIRMVK
jgi:BASS family bile acid:Na+ symporter